MRLRPVLPWAVVVSTLAACSGSALRPDGGPFLPDASTRTLDGAPSSDAIDGASTADAPALVAPMVHRAVATTCPTDRPEPMCMHIAVGDPPVNGGNCTQDSNCASGHNGRCGGSTPNDGSCDVCSYDACFSDAACPGNGPCDCRSGFIGANVCSAGNCRVDADCGPGGYCSPSRSRCPGYDEVETASLGYFCRTSKDTCVEDADCATTNESQQCRYDATAGNWRCIDYPGCPT